ncbi:helix-turn-helix transcriptional regulator [Pyxidicoccus parkwayensis]|uniref:Helix-turn-helix transcriptional regulator n=1 Tax=Pyxidicoccus parkwayensis TaxID=2813578 RepID=A0ABX7NYJ0_9BACT|nr:helix-turn-helix domain-containing protein [Pyxidicoccus parkwaysis]QSQ23967.1 helix-turn-helix transcriptional regulator [Pyxidicoccus parkwaysis]
MKLGNLDLPSDVCRSVGDVLARIGDKWSVLVIVLLKDGSKRFSELRREIGTVSQKMLTATLRGLERDGYVKRTVTPTIPPRVDYELTDLGRDVMVPLNAMANWALSRREQVEAARKAYDKRNKR